MTTRRLARVCEVSALVRSQAHWDYGKAGIAPGPRAPAQERLAAARATASRELCAAPCSAAFCSARRRGRPTPAAAAHRRATIVHLTHLQAAAAHGGLLVPWAPRHPRAARSKRAPHRGPSRTGAAVRSAAGAHGALTPHAAQVSCLPVSGGSRRRHAGSMRARMRRCARHAGAAHTPCKQRCQLVPNPGALAAHPMLHRPSAEAVHTQYHHTGPRAPRRWPAWQRCCCSRTRRAWLQVSWGLSERTVQ